MVDHIDFLAVFLAHAQARRVVTTGGLLKTAIFAIASIYHEFVDIRDQRHHFGIA
jgi:hypothetical protein